MATKTWVGQASARRHRHEITPSSAGAAGVLWWFTVGGVRAGPQVVSDGNLDNLLTALAATYSAAGPEWAEMLYDADTTNDKIVVLGPADGRDPALELTESTGVIAISQTEPVTGTGPSHWSNVENWLEGSVPVGTNDLVFRGGTPPKYDLPGTGTTFASVTFTAESAGAGLPDVNPAGYVEYLSTRRLALSCTGAVLVQTAALVRLDLQPAAARTVTVAGPATAAGGLDLVTNTSTTPGHTLVVTSGRCVVADAPGEVAKLDAVTVAQDAAACVLGAGVTLNAFTQAGGGAAVRCGWTTLTHTGGDLAVSGATAGTTWTQTGGRAFDTGTGTVGTRTAGGYYRYTGTGRTFTTTTAKPFGKLLDPNRKVTFTNPVDMTGVSLAGPPGEVGDSPFWLAVGVGRNVTV